MAVPPQRIRGRALVRRHAGRARGRRDHPPRRGPRFDRDDGPRFGRGDSGRGDSARPRPPVPLEELVTTATGPQRRRDIGGAVTTLRVDSLLQRTPFATLSELLATRVPGLLVQRTSGAPGDPAAPAAARAGQRAAQ